MGREAGHLLGNQGASMRPFARCVAAAVLRTLTDRGGGDQPEARIPGRRPRSALQQSLSCALAGSILVVAAACREATVPQAASGEPELAKKAPPPPTASSLNLRVTGNTSWSASRSEER